MLFTRKIGKLVRGDTSPFNVVTACLLGGLLGFGPSLSQGPGLALVLWLLLLMVNANLFLAGVVGLVGKLLYLSLMPLAFQIGRLLLEGPTEGLFAWMTNAPVSAYFGLEYYAVAGGQALGLIWGVATSVFFVRLLKAYRLRMAKREQEGSKKPKKGWVKALQWIFLGNASKKSYEELMAKKVGNPIRVLGMVVAVVVVGLVFVAGRFLTDEVVASLAKRGLEQANGATVDLEGASVDLEAGRIELLGLAMADPNNLDTDLFRSSRIVADVSAADLLRKRFSIDSLVLDNASSGLSRETKGKIVGKAPGESKAPQIELPDFKDLDSVLENAEVWKERLGQLRRWVEGITSATPTEILEKGQQWDKHLSDRIRSSGYASVDAEFLVEDSPRLWIRKLEALEVKTEYLEGRSLDIVATDLSSSPNLVDGLPTISVSSKDGALDVRLALGAAAGKDRNELKFEYKGIPSAALAGALKEGGNAMVDGGSFDVAIDGDLNVLNSDLVASVTFKDATLSISGSEVPLDGMEMPLQIRGPIDSPSVKLEADFLKRALAKAGKRRLLDEASKEFGVDLGDDTSGEGLKKAAEGILGGFLKKKKEEE